MDKQQVLERAQGCFLGQLAGDSLGSLVEFQSPEEIRALYPDGVRELADGGTWNTIAGQPTDDSEMALALARTLVREGQYLVPEVLEAYEQWLRSGPFDCGMTVRNGLSDKLNYYSQANGAMMRISPLGIFGVNYDLDQVAEWAREDADLTHPNPVCVHANELYVMAIATAIKEGITPHELYLQIQRWADERQVHHSVMNAVVNAGTMPPQDYIAHAGWVLIAFQNVLWQLLHAESLEIAVIDTVRRGGDTDTNAAICGALLGAVYGRKGIPRQWEDAVLNCRPEAGISKVIHPRPKCYWPVDALELANKLVSTC